MKKAKQNQPSVRLFVPLERLFLLFPVLIYPTGRNQRMGASPAPKRTTERKKAAAHPPERGHAIGESREVSRTTQNKRWGRTEKKNLIRSLAFSKPHLHLLTGAHCCFFFSFRTPRVGECVLEGSTTNEEKGRGSGREADPRQPRDPPQPHSSRARRHQRSQRLSYTRQYTPHPQHERAALCGDR